MELKDELEWLGHRLDEAKSAVEKKTVEYNTKVSRTCTDEWRGRLTPEGQAAELALLVAPLEEAERAALEKTEEAVKLCAQAELLGDSEPELTGADLMQANALREFVKEDVELLDGDGLARAIERAIAVGDKAKGWLLHRYITRRIEADNRAASRVRAQGGSAAESIMTAALRAALEALPAFLAEPAKAELLKKAGALRTKTLALSQLANERRKEAGLEQIKTRMRADYARF